MSNVKFVENHPVTVYKTGWLCLSNHVHGTESAAEICNRKLEKKNPLPSPSWHRAGFSVVARDTGWTFRKIGEHFGVSPARGSQYTETGRRCLFTIESHPGKDWFWLVDFLRGMEDANKLCLSNNDKVNHCGGKSSGLITLYNKLHNTTTTIRPKNRYKTDRYHTYAVSANQIQKATKRLCKIKGCPCGGVVMPGVRVELGLDSQTGQVLDGWIYSDNPLHE